jgi:hypothetical protein
MAAGTLQKIYNLPPGGFLRSSSGFFCRLPNGAIAFVPSVFRMPWHADTARLVGAPDIAKLLRAETIELAVATALLIAGIHFFFFDILDFYMTALSLPIAVLAHFVTVAAAVAAVFALNNASFACVRIRMVAALPKAPGTHAADGLSRWRGAQRLWNLSFLSGDTAANLNKFAVILYMLMFLCSGPLLLVVLLLLFISGKSHALDGMAGLMFALYIIVSLWALVESSMVLHQRMQAGRIRRRANQYPA